MLINFLRKISVCRRMLKAAENTLAPTLSGDDYDVIIVVTAAADVIVAFGSVDHYLI